MCNWCINSITFTSRNYEQLNTLFTALTQLRENNRNPSVATLMQSYGIPQFEKVEQYDCRDYFSDLGKAIIRQGPVYSFNCETSSAWNCNITGFYSLLQKHFPEVNLFFQSEEEGVGLYVTGDDTGCYYSDRYKLDSSVGQVETTEYFGNYVDLVSYMQKCFPDATLSLYFTPAELEAEIKKTYYKDNDDFYCNIHIFRPYDGPIIVSEEVA